MPAVPPVIPVTAPVVAFTVAMVVAPLVHVPPTGALASVTELVGHSVRVPVTGEIAFTVAVTTLWQPVGKIYEMSAVPPAVPTGVITPLADPMFATLVLPLAHVPPTVALARVVVLLAQREAAPVMIPGSGFIDTIAVVKQPPGRV